MVNSLFRVNANNSGVYLSTIYDHEHNPVYVKKSASKPTSILKLKREVQGALWYSGLSKERLICDITELPKYYSIRFNFISGMKMNFRDGYWINKCYVEKAVDKYCEIWSKELSDETIIHGDYSIDNLIFSEEGVTVIDWEHFSSNLIPKGFDALNLIYEQIYILMLNKKINHKVISHANLMLRKLYDSECLHKAYFKNPLKTVQGYIANNLEIWGAQVSKLPIMQLDSPQCSALDGEIYMR